MGGIDAKEQAQNLSAAIASKDNRFIDNYTDQTTDGSTVTIKEAEGEAKGTDLTDPTIAGSGSGAVSGVTADVSSVAEVQGEYTFTIESAFAPGEKLEIINENGTIVYTINFTDGSANDGEVNVSTNTSASSQAQAIGMDIYYNFDGYSGLRVENNEIKITEKPPTDGIDLSALNVSLQ